LAQLQLKLDNGQLMLNITDIASSAALATNSTLLQVFVQAIDSTVMDKNEYNGAQASLLWTRVSESLKTALQSRAEADKALAAAQALSIQQQLSTRYDRARDEMIAFTDALLDAKHVTAEGRALQCAITGQLALLDKHTAADILFYNSPEQDIAALPSNFAVQIRSLVAHHKVGVTNN
jgi:hypothetical protein